MRRRRRSSAVALATAPFPEAPLFSRTPRAFRSLLPSGSRLRSRCGTGGRGRTRCCGFRSGSLPRPLRKSRLLCVRARGAAAASATASPPPTRPFRLFGADRSLLALGRLRGALFAPLLLSRCRTARVRSRRSLPACGTLSCQPLSRGPSCSLRLRFPFSRPLPRSRRRTFAFSRAQCGDGSVATHLFLVVSAIRTTPPSFRVALVAAGACETLGERHTTGELYTRRRVALTRAGAAARLGA